MTLKIGILGGTGFVGQNMAEYFKDKGHTVDVAARNTTPCKVDATNPEEIIRWIRWGEFDAIVNLAAICGGIGLNKAHPATLWSASTNISHSVLEAVARANDIGFNTKLIMVGTVCSYAHSCPVPFKEESLMNYGPPEETNRAYGVAKLNGLYGAVAYHKEHGLKAAALIPVNMYGRYDHFDLENSHVIPAMIRKFIDARDSNNAKVVLWGDGSPTREFLHAKDFSKACLLAIEKMDEPTFINVGTGVETDMKNLADTIARLVGYNGEIEWDTSKPNGQPRRALDITRAKELLGYEPAIPLAEGLADTIRWYENERTSD